MGRRTRGTMLNRVTLAGALAAALLSFERVAAFHDGGVADCERCHTIHNSEDGFTVNPAGPGGAGMLLRYATATDVCLSCHAGANGSVLGADPLNPPAELGGGNFAFLRENELNDSPQSSGPQYPIPGFRAGHTVVSSSWGIPADPDHPSAPGGMYLAGDLSCTSCHDPHGNANFRMLRGSGSTDITGFTFLYPAPVAQGIGFDQGGETRTHHTAYQSGWSDWCANCHGDYHEESSPHVFEHPSRGGLESEIRDSYNHYDGPTNPTGGDYATAYIPELPVEDPAATPASTFGAGPGSQIACVTCHRAHATSAPAAVRWDPNVEFLDSDGIRSGSYPIPNPYDDPLQRALCVKCHYYESTQHGQGHPCMQCHRSGGGP